MVGPSGAADVQAVAVLLLMPCATRSSASRGGGYLLLSPVALSDTPAGVIGGNAILCASVALLQLVVLVLIRQIKKRVSMPATCAMVRFPGVLLLTITSLFQGTFVAALALVSQSENTPLLTLAGVLSLVWCVSVPAAVGWAALRLPRRFVTYSYNARGGRRSRFTPFRRILPIGLVMPDNVRKASLALISGYSKPLLGFALTPFMSPILLGFLTLLPATVAPAGCAAALWASAALHVALAAALLLLQVHRSLISRLSTSAGLIMTSVAHLLVLLHAAPPSTDSFLVAQSTLAIARCVISIAMTVAERTMLHDVVEANTSLSLSKRPRWVVGDGGARYGEEFDSIEAEQEQDEGEGDGQEIRKAPIPEGPPSDANDSAALLQRRGEREERLLRQHDERVASMSSQRQAQSLRELFDIHRQNIRQSYIKRESGGGGSREVEGTRVQALRLILDCIACERRMRKPDQQQEVVDQ